MNEHISSEELERRAELERARIAETAEQLRNKLTPGQLVDEALNYARESGSSGLLHNLKGQVRDNPLALAMVGAGMAWLMAGPGYGGRSNGRGDGAWDADDRDMNAGLYGSGREADRYGDSRFSDPFVGDDFDGMGEGGTNGNGNGSTFGSASRTARDAYHSAGEQVHSAMDAASERMRHARHFAKRGAADLRHYAERGSNMLSDLMEREPLAIGALGFAIGAAIGAALPSTRLEDEYLGPTRDHLKDDAAEALKKGAEQAKDVAVRATEAAKEEADREGLLPDDDRPIAEKGASVFRAATDEVKKSFSSSESNSGTGGGSGTGTGSSRGGTSSTWPS